MSFKQIGRDLNPATRLDSAKEKNQQLDDMLHPKMPEPTPAQQAMESKQRETLTLLDAQENERRKRLLSAMQGARAFRGSAIARTTASVANRGAGIPGGATPAPGSAGVNMAGSTPYSMFNSSSIGKFGALPE